MPINFGNVQGLVTKVYPYRISRHLLFRFDDPKGAKAFLARQMASVTWADQVLEGKPEPVLNIGISYPGLLAMGVDANRLSSFDAAFKEGPDPEPLGDAPGSASDPIHWWEGQFKTEEVHCILHLYFTSEEKLEAVTEEIGQEAHRHNVKELIPRRDGTRLDGRSLGGRKLHFGYKDGISHPDICWEDGGDNPGQINFRHFLLGYSTPEIASFPDTEPAATLVRDGSFEVFRWLYQDVATFNSFLRREGPKLAPHLSQLEAEGLLAAKLMGRWRNGSPLVLSSEKEEEATSESNAFLYARSDPLGHKCPFSAHIRVTNPRDQALEPKVKEPVPHVIRRGMPYGPELASQQDDGKDRGIIGMFLCSDIRRQFYTLTRWIKKNDFSPVFQGNMRVQDPLMGNRKVSGTRPEFIVPTPSGPKVIRGLPDFIATKGTAFFLLPSRATLETLTGEP